MSTKIEGTPWVEVDASMDEIKAFIDRSPERGSTWVENDVLQIFVRVAKRLPVNGVLRKTLDISNITVTKKWQNQGVFTCLLNDIETLVASRMHLDGIYVENVMTPRFQHSFEANAKYRLVSTATALGEKSYFYAKPIKS